MDITKGTLIRTVMFVLVVINFVLEKVGIDIIPADENTITMLVEYLIEIAVLVVGFWKNNSFTPAAIKADEVLKQLKNS